MSIQTSVRDYYISRWGTPSRQARFEVQRFQIEVYKWNEERISEGVTLYATLGASTHPVRGFETTHRFEFILGITPGHDEIASPLAALGLYATRENATIGHGHTVPAAQPLWPETNMRTFLVVKPRVAFLAPLDLGDEIHVEFLQAIPIYETERMISAERGAEHLIERWKQNAVPFWKSDRQVDAS
jgi:hypothetical protein